MDVLILAGNYLALGRLAEVMFAFLVVYTIPLALALLLVAVTAVRGVRSSRRQQSAAHNGKDSAMGNESDLGLLCTMLREADIFEGLTDHELRLVASIGERRYVAAGERLAQAGSRGGEVFTIFRGELRLLNRSGGDETSVRLARANETVPLAALLDPPVLVTTIEAATDGEVFAIPRARLIELCDLQPMMGLQIYRSTAKAFERRYRKTLEGLAASLRPALHFARTGGEIDA